MLKLKDIFNIDLNSKGGGKLYKKIMRKYNIPLKDTKEVKQEIVECSSGAGEGGIKEYYYKFNDTNIESMHESIAEILTFCSIVTGFIDKLGTCLNKYTDRNKEIYPIEKFFETSNVIAFSILDKEVLSYYYADVSIYSKKGDLYSKTREYLSAVKFPQDQIELYMEAFKSTFEEITKEEYEAMITYKP